MKRSKLPDIKLRNTVWSTLDMKKEIPFNYKEIEVLFAAKEVTSKKKGSSFPSPLTFVASKYLVSHIPFTVTIVS